MSNQNLIIEELNAIKVRKSEIIEFPTEDEALEFADSNGINRDKVYNSEMKGGYYYILKSDIPKPIKRVSVKAPKGTFYDKRRFNQLSDKQIHLLYSKNGITSTKDGYYVNWDVLR